jgi:hypothetical protein
MAISDHNMTVIKSGSTPTKQKELYSIDINSGERFDVLISTMPAPNSSGKRHHIRIQSNWRGDGVDPSGVNDMGFFLRYDGSSSVAPLNNKSESKPWTQQSTEIVMPDSTATTATVAEPTRTFTFNIAQVNEDNCTNTWIYVYEYGSANI